MNREVLAENLFLCACSNQAKRMTFGKENDPWKVTTGFKAMDKVVQDNYLCLADYVLNKFELKK